jgi:hypothetical protein
LDLHILVELVVIKDGENWLAMMVNPDEQTLKDGHTVLPRINGSMEGEFANFIEMPGRIHNFEFVPLVVECSKILLRLLRCSPLRSLS